ncbi:hypothetical protein [Haloprofundus halobius]|uniref:hypothetical protein n=1 Tax=Haloprofundus halobius TaxID=2876194 RepID=UPI001CCAAAEB|nr:hypothetical protein [Haloprofundus halobius]
MSTERFEGGGVTSSAAGFVARHPRVLVICIALAVGIATQGTVGAETMIEPYNGHSTATGP